MRISTAEAAKLLGMSKPYLILLMREREIDVGILGKGEKRCTTFIYLNKVAEVMRITEAEALERLEDIRRSKGVSNEEN